MAKKQYTYTFRQLPATPRNKRLTDSIEAAAGSGGGVYVGGGVSTPQYWELVTTTDDGTALTEEQYYLRPVTAKNIVVPGDVTAFAENPDPDNEWLPVAQDYTTTGLFRAVSGGGLVFDAEGNGWKVDPSYAGGGLDEEKLKEYLTANKYVTETWLTEKGYLTLQSPLTGYAIAEEYQPITEQDTILSALGKLEVRFGNYVDLTTDQLIGGTKTFKETVYSQKDVVAFAGDETMPDLLPVAGYTTTGLVRIQSGGGIIVDESGIISVDPDYAGGGGVSFTTGTALQLTSQNVLNVLLGTTSGTACAGNDSRLSDARRNPYSITFSGYDSGSYNGSSALSIAIPSNTSQLSNGAGYITGITRSMVLDVLGSSGNNSKYLAGDGVFYTIQASEINFPDGFVTLSTQQYVSGYKYFTGGISVGPTGNVHILLGEGSGNCINGVTSSGSMGNLYLNYTGSSQYTRIDSSNNIVTTGDVVAYSTGSSLSDYAPVADSYTYGLVKYDNSTIKRNSSGQLYCTVEGGGGGGSDVSWGAQNQYAGEITISGTTYKFIKSGAISASATYTSGTNIGNINIGGNVKTFYVPNKVGTSTVGSSSRPIYLSSGTPTACSSTVGSASKPVYMSSGTITACTGSSLFSSMSVSGSTLYVTVAGQQRSVSLPSSSGGGGWESGTYTDNAICRVNNSGSGGLAFWNSSGSTGILIGGGNGIKGYSGSYGSVGNLYINYVSSSTNVRIDSSGRIYSNGSQVTSDLRLKTIIGYEENVLGRMLKIPVIRFRRTDIANSDETTGFGAQSFLGVFNNVTFINEDSGYYGINEGAILGIAFQGVKELYHRFLPIESEVSLLKQKVNNMKDRLDNAYREIFALKGGAA